MSGLAKLTKEISDCGVADALLSGAGLNRVSRSPRERRVWDAIERGRMHADSTCCDIPWIAGLNRA